MINKDQELAIYKKMHFARTFENFVRLAHQSGKIYVPIYLSVGQESIPATLSEFFEQTVPIFAQHRSHSYYLSFGGSPTELKNQLLSNSLSEDNGVKGSASIAHRGIKMYGHSGFMGDQVPIAAGYAMVTRQPVITVVGDASAEEDYVLGALGFVADRDIPVLLICEDNDLSILTPKNIRRNWNLVDVAKSFGCDAVEISDSPHEIWSALENWNMKKCLVININTKRHLWHAGSGQDSKPLFDTLLNFRKKITSTENITVIEKIELNNNLVLGEIWNDTI